MSESIGQGKWARPGVPHKGWRCFNIEDLGEVSAVCEMCESQEIRFVHHMEHDEHEPLACGCICAGHMEGNIPEAQRRERYMKSIDGRRRRWLTRLWKVSRKGNPYLTVGAFMVSVFRDGDGWRGFIARRTEYAPLAGFTKRTSSLIYPTIEAAKLAVFNVLIALEKREK